VLNGIVRFGRFEADLASGELWCDGHAVALQDLPFRVLAALVENPGEVVSRADLSRRLWGTETFVDAAAGLNTAVAKLREALGDSAEHPLYVETIPKRGYRFIAPVTAVARRLGTAADELAGTEPQRWSSTAYLQGAGIVDPLRRLSPRLIWTAAAAVLFVSVLFAAFQLRADRPRMRVAVVLFDNETGRADAARLAQNLTDATVTALAADARLAVIGNAAALRSQRPFRDIAKIRDAVGADFIVIGQVQSVDDKTIVRTHLIRAIDQSHLTVDVFPLSSAGEAALQEAVGRGVHASIARAIE
jgi:DNA-binding winged helix-turn-helix (wHTH) protein/TolB-like protein